MFVREHTVTTRGKEYTYLEVVENVWTDDGHRQRKLLGLGNKNAWPPERISQFRLQLQRLEAKWRGEHDFHPLQGAEMWEYGEALALDTVWRRLQIDRHLQACLEPFKVEFDVANAIKVMVLNRLIDPHSKLGLGEWGRRYYFPGLGLPAFPVHQYYRALDYLVKIKDELEPRVRARMKTLFNGQGTLVFYDLTSTYFHGAMDRSELACLGKSKDGRPGCKQIMIGLLVDPEGMPITHHVFTGNTRDTTTVREVASDLASRFDIRHCIFVGDCGTLDAKSIVGLKGHSGQRQYDYITSLRLRRNKQGEALVDQLPARDQFQRPPQDYRGKEWLYALPAVQDEDGHTIRYLAAYHPPSARASAEARINRTVRWCERLQHLGRPADARKRKDAPKKIRQSIENFLRDTGAAKFFQWQFHRNYKLEYELLASPWAYEQARDGLQILKTDSTTLSDWDVLRGYRTLWRVERAFREMKDNIEIQPNHHQTDTRIAGHVFCCVLAYLLENVIDRWLDEAGLDWSARAALERLRAVHALVIPVVDERVPYVCPPDTDNRRILSALGLRKMPVNP